MLQRGSRNGSTVGNEMVGLIARVFPSRIGIFGRNCFITLSETIKMGWRSAFRKSQELGTRKPTGLLESERERSGVKGLAVYLGC